MNKPLTMVIKETKKEIANICNQSGLPPVILDLILQGIYSEVHSLSERQTLEEEMAYAKMLAETSDDISIANENANIEE